MEVIRLSHISLVRDKKRLIQNVSLSIKKGEHWALLGPNGSGKTMLLQIITGYVWPTKGSVALLGNQYGNVPIRILRKRIGYVTNMLTERINKKTRVIDVVVSGYFGTYGLYDKVNDAMHKNAQRLLSFFSLSKKMNKWYGQLSFGEQKRVAIARSLVSSPDVLLLDEPSNGLDIKARHQFLPYLEQIAHIKNGPTIVLVTHHIDELPPSISHIAFLKNGKIKISGEKKNMLTEKNIQDIFKIKGEISLRNGWYYLSIHK